MCDETDTLRVGEHVTLVGMVCRFGEAVCELTHWHRLGVSSCLARPPPCSPLLPVPPPCSPLLPAPPPCSPLLPPPPPFPPPLLPPGPQLSLGQANWSAPLAQAHLGPLLKDLADVERLLRDVDLLSALARLLPKGACAGHGPPAPSNTTSAWPLNNTTWGPNATDTPGQDGGEGEQGEGGGGAGRGEENPHSQFSAFVQLWAGLQPILCGNNR